MVVTDETLVYCGTPECHTRIDEPSDLPASERKPCPKCGTLSRQFYGSVSSTIHVTSSVEATVERGLNDTRLAVLGILVGISLTVGFGVQTCWPYRVALAVGSFVFAAGLIRWRRSRHWLMKFMHWLTGH